MLRNNIIFMKKLAYLFVSLMLFAVSVNAQDVVVLRDGNLLNAKVIEITETTIRYKKWENIDGPTYLLSKEMVLAINYENGTKDVFENVVKEKSDIAQSIDVAGSKITNSVAVSGSNISRGIDNSVYLKQQDMINSGKTIRTIGYVVGALCIGGGAAAAVLTGEAWIGGVGAGVALLVGGGIAWMGQRKINSAEAITVANLCEFNVTDDLAINVCSINNNLNKEGCMGAGVSFTF